MQKKKRSWGLSAFSIDIKDCCVPFDIRFVGDYYYDPVWARNMLEKKTYMGLVPTMNNYNYFFSFLYHVKIQKTEVKEVYISRLIDLSKKIGLDNINSAFILNDNLCAKIINQFLKRNKYYYFEPLDSQVPNNTNLTRLISVKMIDVDKFKAPLKLRVIQTVRKFTPSMLVHLFPKKLRHFIVKK